MCLDTYEDVHIKVSVDHKGLLARPYIRTYIRKFIREGFQVPHVWYAVAAQVVK